MGLFRKRNKTPADSKDSLGTIPIEKSSFCCVFEIIDSSFQEWKFYRLEMIMENQSTSFQPPPTNLVIVPLDFLVKKAIILRKKWCCGSNSEAKESLVVDSPDTASPHDTGMHLHMDTLNGSQALHGALVEKTLKKMRVARDDVIDKENEDEQTSLLSIVQGLQERLRTLMNERGNDRTFIEKKFKELAEAKGTSAPDQVKRLVQQNEVLVTQIEQLASQNREILALLQQQQQQLQHLQAQQ